MLWQLAEAANSHFKAALIRLTKWDRSKPKHSQTLKKNPNKPFKAYYCTSKVYKKHTHAVFHHHKSTFIAFKTFTLKVSRGIDTDALATKIRRDAAFIDICKKKHIHRICKGVQCSLFSSKLWERYPCSLPVQFLSSESRANPLSHLHLKLPMVFLHFPWVQRLGNILHSLMSENEIVWT